MGEEDAEAKIKTPLFTFSIKGQHYMLINVFLMMITVALFVLGTFIFNHDANVTSALESLRLEQKKTTEAQIELNYIQTLSQKEKENLKLDMPESLRKKLYNR